MNKKKEKKRGLISIDKRRKKTSEEEVEEEEARRRRRRSRRRSVGMGVVWGGVLGRQWRHNLGHHSGPPDGCYLSGHN